MLKNQSQKSDSIERKFVDSIDLDEWEIETDSGWQDISAIHKTVEYQIYIIKTESGKTLKCADDHIIFDENYNEIFTKECIPNQTYMITKDGPELVTELIITDDWEHMYDVTVESDDHRFYSNDILSHNTTVTVAYLLYYSIFEPHKIIGVLANKAQLAKEILDRYKLAYENLPFFLQQGIVAWNKKDIELENGSKIITSATGGDAARGYSFSMMFLDEAAFVPANVWEPFWTSVWPTVSSGKKTKVVMVSTPNGMNHYHQMWSKANHEDPKLRSEFAPFEVNWREIPGRDEAWKEAQIRNTDEATFAQEYNCEFMGSSNTLLSGYALKSIAPQHPIYDVDNLTIFEPPLPDHQYVISVDVGHGKGLDKSAFSIIDITNYPFKQVGTFYDNYMSPLIFPHLIMKTGYDYNEAYVLIESNDVGLGVVNDLYHDLEYDNIVSPQPIKSNVYELGLKQTKSTKSKGCSTMSDLIEAQKLVIQCKKTLLELSGFIIKGNSGSKKYAADEGYNDDLVMTLVNFAYLTTCEEFEEMQDADLRDELFAKRMLAISEEVLPMPIIDDGLDNINDMEYIEGFGMVENSGNSFV